MRYYLLALGLISQLHATEPAWLIDPSLHGKYVGAIGCAKKMADVNRQEKIALLRAKGSISQEIETEVEDTAHHETTVDDDIFEEEFNFESKQNSSTTFEIKQMATYHYKNGMLCVWVIKK
jgi:hypothetical protein